MLDTLFDEGIDMDSECDFDNMDFDMDVLVSGTLFDKGFDFDSDCDFDNVDLDMQSQL